MKLVLFVFLLCFSKSLFSQEDSHRIMLKYMDIIEGDDPKLTSEKEILIAKSFLQEINEEISKTSDEIRLAYYYYYTGDIYFRLKNYNESIKNFSASLSHHFSDSGMVYLNIFLSYKELRRDEDAILTINKAIDFSPSKELYYFEKMKFYIENSNIEEARIFCLNTMREHYDFNYVAYVYLNFLYEKEREKLNEEAQKLLKIDDRIFVSYYFLIKQDYDKSKNSKRTKYYIQKLEELDTDKIYISELKRK